MYQDWLFKDHPSGWRLRYKRNGGGYEVSRDGVNWRPVPSVTQITGILNKNLHEWAVRQVVEYLREELVPGLVITEEEAGRILDGAAKAHRQAVQKAAGRGSDFHAWAEAYLKGKPFSLPSEEPLRSMAQALVEWWEGNGGRAARGEEAVFHPEHLYAGRVDLVAHFGGRLLVVDLKTSSRVYPEHLLQVGAYALALQAEGVAVEGGMVLCLGDGLKPVEVPLEEAAEAFLGLLQAWRFVKGLSP
ncbi:PD-(D/E)XK nuclease family protein [Thermus hydrothermalis]|uniref:PD-(D/E)XK nuclease family protein n=1 Tax=Thermus hydrothermalis TaxID=2908148 RepID=UPI00242ED906|nr:PD-(D/E)XK nuclease family protein [Thermus hydrothermalis]